MSIRWGGISISTTLSITQYDGCFEWSSTTKGCVLSKPPDWFSFNSYGGTWFVDLCLDLRNLPWLRSDPPPLPTPPAACTTVVCKTPAKFFTLKKNDSWLMHDSWQFPLLKLHRELKKKGGLAWFLHNWCGKKTKKAFILFCFGAFFLKLPTLF